MYSRRSGDSNRQTKVPKGYSICLRPPARLHLKISGRELTETALLPVVARQTVVALGPRRAVLALAETRGVAAVVDGAHLVAVAL